MSTLQQNLQRPFYIKHLLERLRYGKAAVAMRREAAELIEKMNEDSSNLSAQNSYQAMRIEELERDLAARDAELAAMEETANKRALRINELLSKPGYRCFHCKQVFTDEDLAREHFGNTTEKMAKCMELLERGSAGGPHSPFPPAVLSLQRAEAAEAEASKWQNSFHSMSERAENHTVHLAELELDRDEWKRKAEEAARDSGRYANPSDEAINASFAGLIEDQCVPLQIKRREEFKRRYLLVIAAIAAKGDA